MEKTTVSFGTDVPRLKGDHKKYLFGPRSILHAHGEKEHIAVPDLIEPVTVYKRIALAALKSK